jgi:uncharacterized protein (DUF924 family)
VKFSNEMPDTILKFWFEELAPAQWWRVDAVLDATIRTRFGEVHRSAAAGELFAWREMPAGRLAEIIVLDQFSRNLYRGTPQGFACDAMALALAQEAVRARADAALDAARRGFLYMPYMHSESAVIHAQAAPLFAAPGLENHAKSALQHKAIIDRFGRYPHRNAVLGRASTPEEIAFLLQPNSGF